MDLWNTPLYTHAILEEETDDDLGLGYISHEQKDSILLVKTYKFQEEWGISYAAIIEDLKKIRDEMARIYFYFKARYLEHAKRALADLARLPRGTKNYQEILFRAVDDLLPIFTIYEILQRPLSDSAYPEMMQSKQKLLSFVARFFGWKYNPLGVSLMYLHNTLAYRRWSWLIHQRNLSFPQFYRFIENLPIWTHIPGKSEKKVDQSGDNVEPPVDNIELTH